MRPGNFTMFRDNILRAMEHTSTDEELKKELHKLLSKEVDKETPFLIKPVHKVNKIVH